METQNPPNTTPTHERTAQTSRRGRQPALGATLGTNQYDQTYMTRVDRSTGSIRTPNTALIRKMLRWKSSKVELYARFAVAATGQWVCEEHVFPIRMWRRIALEAGLTPKPPMSKRKRLALERARASSAKSRRRRDERVASAS
jgi:hypothetical protein